MDGPSAARVTARLLLSSMTDMDRYARARIVEAAAGLPKWSISSDVNAFAAEGPQQFPDVDPSWFATGNHGLAQWVFNVVHKYLGEEVATDDRTTQEVAQDLAAGLSPSGAERADIYGSVGKHNARRILDGSLKPYDGSVKSSLTAIARHTAIDVWRKRKRRQEKIEQVELDPSISRRVVDESPADLILMVLSSPKAREFRNWIYRSVQKGGTEAQRRVFDGTLDYIQAHNKYPSGQQLREFLAKTGYDVHRNTINKHRRKVIPLIQKAMEEDDELLDWLERHIDLARLGYGGGGQFRSARMAARLIKRVAARYLSAKGYTLSPEEEADVTLDQWQKDIGDGVVAALKRFPGARAVGRWRPGRGDEILVSMTLPPVSSWQEMDRYDRMEVVTHRELRIVDHLEKALKGILGVSRSHDPWGGFGISKDYIIANSKDGVTWQVEVLPHRGR